MGKGAKYSNDQGKKELDNIGAFVEIIKRDLYIISGLQSQTKHN